MSGVYEIEIWWDEDDAFAYDTGWKMVCNGNFYSGSNRADLILEALGR